MSSHSRPIQSLTIVGLWVLLALSFGCGTQQPEAEQPAFTDLAPADADLTRWTNSFEPEIYVGEDLFQLINGGAEMYHEFGFVQVLSAEYVDADQHAITFELFELTDPEAAYGVYSFKRGSAGDPIELGNECVLQDYYLNLWSGSYVLTLTGMDNEQVTIDGIKAIAEATNAKIGAFEAQKPSLATALESIENRTSNVHYLGGDLALSNVLPFGSGARFHIKNGAEVKVGDSQVFVLGYDSEEEAQHALDSAVDALIGGDRFVLNDVDSEEPIAVLMTEEGSSLRLETQGTNILGSFGPDFDGGVALIETLKTMLTPEGN
jgi:hypothetical protein